VLAFLASTVLVTALGCGSSDEETPPAESSNNEREVAEYRGAVIESSDRTLVIVSGEKEVEFVVTETTAFKDADLHDIEGVQEGDEVIVLSERDGDTLVATRVRLQQVGYGGDVPPGQGPGHIGGNVWVVGEAVAPSG
jgi:hypothetical protein